MHWNWLPSDHEHLGAWMCADLVCCVPAPPPQWLNETEQPCTWPWFFSKWGQTKVVAGQHTQTRSIHQVSGPAGCHLCAAKVGGARWMRCEPSVLASSSSNLSSFPPKDLFNQFTACTQRGLLAAEDGAVLLYQPCWNFAAALAGTTGRLNSPAKGFWCTHTQHQKRALAIFFLPLCSSSSSLADRVMVDMESDPSLRPSPVPRPRPFPGIGLAPGPRCGHTLTAISGPEGDLSKAKLVLFGEQLLQQVP